MKLRRLVLTAQRSSQVYDFLVGFGNRLAVGPVNSHLIRVDRISEIARPTNFTSHIAFECLRWRAIHRRSGDARHSRIHFKE